MRLKFVISVETHSWTSSQHTSC